MKRSVLFLMAVSFLLALTSSSFAIPVAKPVTLGITPRDVVADTSDIFRKATTGLPNVGLGETIYLGQKVNPAENAVPDNLTGWTWAVTARPNNSQAQLSASDAAVVSFVPDLVGTYSFTLVVVSDSGQSAPVVLKVNAGNYVGVGNITGEPDAPKCAGCHDGQVDPDDPKLEPWGETKHAGKFTRDYSGAQGRSGYRASCIGCHTVGFNTDQTAVNHGFDDVATQESWVFRDSARGGMQAWAFDSMKIQFPETAAMANIQCESCHGPGSRHIGNVADNRIVSTFDVGVCAKCHDSGTHHFRPMQWKLSGHSRQPMEERSPCANCHSGIGFVDKLNGVHDTLVTKAYQPIGCATCHDPHSATNPYQLRTVAPYMLLDSTVVNFGNGNLCINCHHARRIATLTQISGSRPRLDPHGSPQGDMVAGRGMFTFGERVRNSPHAQVVENVCVGCHMAETPEVAADTARFLKLGDHTFHMKTASGVEHTEVCASCHGEVEDFSEIGADNDWDGDGTYESVPLEMAGMVQNIKDILPPEGPTAVFDSTWTTTQRMALWNANFVNSDGSGGYHNASYALGVLRVTLNVLGVEMVDETVPLTYSLSEAYPNPFNPSTTLNYNLAKTGEVSIKVFDMAGRVVQTVASGEYKAGQYRSTINLAGESSGVYILRMQAGSFDASKKLVLVK